MDVGCGSGELASLITTDQYLGIDIDEESLNIAKLKHPGHCFKSDLPSANDKFDTIISLAVIEHVYKPETFLQSLAELLYSGPKSRIVLTSPHPITDKLHYIVFTNLIV